LQATITGLCSTCSPSINTWTISEDTSGGGCVWSNTPPTVPCPSGTIQLVVPGNFLTATYHAPSTSGTFHVVAEWCICFGSSITKDGKSTITVP
jgi:hypothetical protein